MDEAVVVGRKQAMEVEVFLKKSQYFNYTKESRNERYLLTTGKHHI